MALESAFGAPWITIWTEPRRTIRNIVDRDPAYGVMLLAALAGALSALESRWMQMPTHPGSIAWPLFVAISVALGAIIGIVVLYVNGFLLKWSGAVLGGIANYAEVRAALAWGEIPAMTAVALGIVAVLIGVSGPLGPAGAARLSGPGAGFGLVHAVLGIWSFVVTLKCLGEVHRFSAWRALGSILLVGLGFLILFLILIAAGVSVGRLLHPTATI